MKRKKQIVRNIILIALTVLLFLWQGGYHLTPEGVFRSAEKAEWLGPTPEVMELGTSDDGCLRFVGIEQKGFYVVSAKPCLGIFWKYTNEHWGGYFPVEETTRAWILEDIIVGQTRETDAVEVVCVVEKWKSEENDWQEVGHYTIPVGENGFFSMALDSYMPITMDYGVKEVICKNAAGEVIGKDSQ